MVSPVIAHDYSEMNTTEELVLHDRMKWALEFVTNRIHDQARFVSEPIDEDDEEKLTKLPDSFVIPEFSIVGGAEAPIPPDRSYDKLVRLARLAVDSDRHEVPERILQWELADIILRLNEHRMAWLIERAGIEFKKPWWDVWLAIPSGIFLLVMVYGSAFLADLLGIHDEKILVGIALILLVGIAVLLKFLLKRFERWHWRNRMWKLTAELEIGKGDSLY
jgi:hypothetical protein